MLLKKIIHKIVLFDGKNLDNKYQGAVMIHQSSQSQPMLHSREKKLLKEKKRKVKQF